MFRFVWYLGDDFTFSQENGTRIPYGTSGDCYNRYGPNGCPQGRFSVDLTHTSFKIAHYVEWTRRYPSSQINKVRIPL